MSMMMMEFMLYTKKQKKDGFSVFHKTLKRDKKEWDELCELYPF